MKSWKKCEARLVGHMLPEAAWGGEPPGVRNSEEKGWRSSLSCVPPPGEKQPNPSSHSDISS